MRTARFGAPLRQFPLSDFAHALAHRFVAFDVHRAGLVHDAVNRGDPQRIGYPGLPGAARARDDDVLPARCPCAVRRLEHLRTDIS